MKKIIGLLMMVAICIMFGCNTENSTKYNGKNLNIAVVGEVPIVREDIVTFDKVSFSDLEKENFSNNYDAVFISKEKDEDLSYEEVPDLEPDMYITGILFDNENEDYNSIIYGLYNDTENKKNIEDMYSRIFKSIDEKQLFSEEQL